MTKASNLNQVFDKSQGYEAPMAEPSVFEDGLSLEGAIHSIETLYLNDIHKPLRLSDEEKALLGWPKDSDSMLDRYLTKNEEARLSQHIQSGKDKDGGAKNLLIKKNLPFAVMLAKDYQGRGLPVMDLIQEANRGLEHAAKKFDSEKGRFTTYATRWINQYVDKALMDQARDIRIPIHVQKERRQCVNAEKALSQSLLRQPKLREIAEKVDKPLGSVMRLLNYQNGNSIDGPASKEQEGHHNDGSLLEEGLGDEVLEGLLIHEAESLIFKFLDEDTNLSARDRGVIVQHFGLGRDEKYTREELSHLHGFARSNVEHIMKKFSKHFKEWLRDRDIHSMADLEIEP